MRGRIESNQNIPAISGKIAWAAVAGVATAGGARRIQRPVVKILLLGAFRSGLEIPSPCATAQDLDGQDPGVNTILIRLEGASPGWVLPAGLDTLLDNPFPT